MPDILGATNPVPGYDKAISNRNIPVSPENTQIQNIPDPSRVGRTDGRTEQQDSTLQGDGHVRYDSNFQTFLQRLRQTPGMGESLSKIFAGGERTIVSSGMGDGIAEEMAKIIEMLRLSGEDLLEFLKAQFRSETRFSGALFALLRTAYAKAASEGVRTDILRFLKCYVNFSSSAHIEESMLRNLAKMADAMPGSWAAKLQQLSARLENGIATGDRQGSLLLLQREIFPYMAGYVERTHDMGLPRVLLNLLALDVARYENGAQENLLEAFHQLTGYGTLRDQLGKIDDRSLLALLKNSQFDLNSNAVQFSNHLAAAAARALRGEGSAEIQQAFSNLVSAMLINESVYMPVNHYLMPLEWNGRLLFSELWVDPDAEEGERKKGSRGNSVKILFKMDVQTLGCFDVIFTSQGNEADIRIMCPEKVLPFSKQIEQSLSEILTRNGLVPSKVMVRKLERPVTLTEVFPKIFERRNSINVKA